MIATDPGTVHRGTYSPMIISLVQILHERIFLCSVSRLKSSGFPICFHWQFYIYRKCRIWLVISCIESVNCVTLIIIWLFKRKEKYLVHIISSVVHKSTISKYRPSKSVAASLSPVHASPASRVLSPRPTVIQRGNAEISHKYMYKFHTFKEMSMIQHWFYVKHQVKII